MPSVFFISAESPSTPEKNAVDSSVAYANGRAALEAAKANAKTKYGDKAIIRALSEDKVGVFVDVAGDLALLFTYQLKAVELLK